MYVYKLHACRWEAIIKRSDNNRFESFDKKHAQPSVLNPIKQTLRGVSIDSRLAWRGWWWCKYN